MRCTSDTRNTTAPGVEATGEAIVASVHEGEQRLQAQQQRTVGANDGDQGSEGADVHAIGDGAKVIPMRRRGKR